MAGYVTAMSSEKVTVADLDLNDEHMTIGLSDTLKEAAKRLLSIPGGVLVVLADDSKVKGVIGHKQLLLAIDSDADTKNATCAEHMEMDFMEVKLDEDLQVVMQKIRQRSPQAVVAIDEHGDFNGYFAPNDYQASRDLVKSLKKLKL